MYVEHTREPGARHKIRKLNLYLKLKIMNYMFLVSKHFYISSKNTWRNKVKNVGLQKLILF